jgi:hypothetical protein
LEGFHESWPRGAAFSHFHKLRMSFGTPIAPPPLETAGEGAYEALTAELKERVAELWLPLHSQNDSNRSVAAD